MLSVLHAIPSEPREAIPLEPLPGELNGSRLEAEQQMKNLGDRIGVADLNRRLLIEQGRIWDILASVIRRENIDLLIFGTHGRSGLKKAVLGSVAEQVLRMARGTKMLPARLAEEYGAKLVLFPRAALKRSTPRGFVCTHFQLLTVVAMSCCSARRPISDCAPECAGPMNHSRATFLDS